jgi:hypothetical protein
VASRSYRAAIVSPPSLCGRGRISRAYSGAISTRIWSTRRWPGRSGWVPEICPLTTPTSSTALAPTILHGPGGVSQSVTAGPGPRAAQVGFVRGREVGEGMALAASAVQRGVRRPTGPEAQPPRLDFAGSARLPA